MISVAIAAVAVAAWLYLLLARGAFWRCRERDGGRRPTLATLPTIAIVIPARNEAECIAESLGSLLRQDYAGGWSIVLVDDGSTDGTTEIALATAASSAARERLLVIQGQPLPAGWTGKLWAVKQGIDAAEARTPQYLLLSDADIAYAPAVLGDLVAKARTDCLVLSSLMAKLNCRSPAEIGLVPAFIFFFQMLYPFAWVNQSKSRTAGAAGGCMLVRADALRAVGGIASIRNALIDDCALARQLKTQGPIRLCLTEQVRSIRPYPRLGDIRQMVSRSAYAQLRYSPWLLLGTVLGMLLVYVAPPVLALAGSGLARWLGLTAWILMSIAFIPTLRFYRLPDYLSPALPLIALCYMLFTIDSAVQHLRGRGGFWKGRVQATE